MDIDVSRTLGLVTRGITSRDHEGRRARVLTATRVYDTSPDDLWDALTNPERIPRWFLPVSGDFREGGTYALEGNASGDITTCDPPAHLALTWGMHGDVSWVDVTLAPEGDGTRLRLEHIAHVPDEFWDQFGPGAVGVGWDGALLGLDRHLVDDQAVDHTTVEAWAKTEQGRAFYGESSDRWAQAAVDDGADAEWAKQAAARTTAFYTGEPVDG